MKGEARDHCILSSHFFHFFTFKVKWSLKILQLYFVIFKDDSSSKVDVKEGFDAENSTL